MKKELKIVKYIKEFGLDKTVVDFKLKVRDYGHKILLKYDQIESDMSLPEVQECRGLILEKGTWKVMCMSFFKFFNSAEGNAAKIDWNTAIVLEKLDGSLIQVYYDWVKGEWFAATSGTGEGEGEVNNKLGTTFNQLFWQTFEKFGSWVDSFNNKHTYVFELTTPYNIVVKPHGESSVTLITIRNNETLEETPFQTLNQFGQLTNIPVVKYFALNNMDDLVKSLEEMPWSEEGYVVVDANFNRVKIKNPAYVAVHHTVTGNAYHNVLQIIKDNEVDEYLAYFVDRALEVNHLHTEFISLQEDLEQVWLELDSFKASVDGNQKAFALEVFRVTQERNLKMFSGLFFSLSNNKVASVRDYLNTLDNKILYNLLIKNFKK